MDEFRRQVGKIDVSADELKLAKTFADSMTETDFDLSQYRDEFEGKVRQLIESKVAGQEVIAPPAVEKEPAVVNLMDALKESLAKAQKAAKPAKPPRIAAPSAGQARQVQRRKTS